VPVERVEHTRVIYSLLALYFISPTTHGSGSVVIAGNGPTTAATRTRRLGTAGVWELYGLQRSLRCAAM